MPTKSKQFFLQVEQVRRPLEAWRRTRKHRESIPEALWTAMARLAKTYGISPVSHALRVEYYGLKRRLAQNASEQSAPSRPAFVELSALPSSDREAGCTIELENRSGARMTLQLDPKSVDVPALIQALWRGRA